MKQISDFTRTTWEGGDFIGERRPAVRATIQRWHADRENYGFWYGESSTWKHSGHYVNCLFNQPGRIRELFNIKSIKYERAVDTDVASCTIELVNSQIRRDRPNPRLEEFDYAGWFTPTRGDNADEWDYGSNVWHDWFLPDRMVKTYEGYGHNVDVPPEQDDHMYPSGVWLIDTVNINTDGIIQLQCRDIGRLLLDHILFPPVVPFDVYPLTFEAMETVEDTAKMEPGGAWLAPSYRDDSNSLVLAADLNDGTQAAVAPNGRVRGHQGQDAVDEDTSTYWLSAGSEEAQQIEWIEFDVPNDDVGGIRLNVRGGPYAIFISIFTPDRGWRGTGRIDYEVAEDGTDLDARIKFVKRVHCDPGDNKIFKLPKVYDNVTRIRLSFRSRWNSRIGTRVYRTALREMRYARDIVKVEVPGGTKVVGNYQDYTDIVKWLLAWSGFYWPRNAHVRQSDRELHPLKWISPDPALARGRVWGDFMKTGTTGIVKLDVDTFDKKPVMDGIAAVREIIGFDFWIDETGAAIWRMANVWKRGNYLMPEPDQVRRRTSNIITIDEEQTLIGLETSYSSKNVREQVLVADVNGNFGVAVKGFNPAPTNQRRVAGWLDGKFRSRSEARRMAELIAVRQAMTYHTATITIPGNPAIQIDDQILVRERQTGESNLHRVLNIASDFDAQNARWTYTLTTQWLGDQAFTENAWEPQLTPMTKAYLQELS